MGTFIVNHIANIFKKGMIYLPEIKVDKEFQSLIPPLSQEEYTQLEANIVSDGCRDALVIWDGVLIDGHNRYRICTEHNIPFQTVEKKFDSRDDAIQWIILNQFGRRNLSPGTRSILALRLEPILAEKAKIRMVSGKPNPVPKSAQGTEIGKTRDGLAKIAGVGHDTIDKVKQIVSRGTPEQVERIKKGDKGNTVNAVYQEVRARDVPKHKPKSVIPKKEPDREISTQEIIDQLHNPDAVPEFTIDLLVEEIQVGAEQYVHSLKSSITIRSTLLSNPENRKKVLSALDGIQSQINKLKEIIK